MKLIDQVCSLELSKRLKELGIKQDSLFYWHNDHGKDYPSYGDPKLCLCSYDNISAFTVAEIDRMLPLNILIEKTKDGYEIGRRILSLNDIDKFRREFIDCYSANARAKMLIYLIENKIIEVPK